MLSDIQLLYLPMLQTGFTRFQIWKCEIEKRGSKALNCTGHIFLFMQIVFLTHPFFPPLQSSFSPVRPQDTFDANYRARDGQSVYRSRLITKIGDLAETEHNEYARLRHALFEREYHSSPWNQLSTMYALRNDAISRSHYNWLRKCLDS